MDKHTAILAIPEIDEITIKEAKRIFLAYKEKNIISDCNFDDDIWNLNNETTGFHFNFKVEEDRFKHFGEKLNLTVEEFKDYLKTFAISQLGLIELVSVQGVIRTIKRTIYDEMQGLEDIVNSCNANYLGRVSEFFSMIPSNGRENELTEWLVQIDDAEELIRSGKSGDKRSLASFESYFRFNDIIKKFWSETTSKEEKLFFFPVWMWWNISAILPLRPCEFVVTPRKCLSKVKEKYFLTIRRNKIKGTGKSKTYKISSDYELNTYEIPEKLAREINWYIENTKDFPVAETNTLFVTYTHYAMWERVAPYTSRYFSYINLRTCLRYFFNLIVEERYGYNIIFDNGDQLLQDDKSIEYLHLGDTRHIALINMISEGATPIVAMMLAGHDNPEMSAHYYSNITQLIECRTYRQYKKQINGKQTYSLSKRTNKLSVKDSTILENGGRCLSRKVANDNFEDCYKVMGPSCEIGLCKNCEYYLDDDVSFNDSKNKYVNKIKQECDLLEGIVKKVRGGKGEPEEIISAILRIRDNSHSYKQYLLEKMEGENNAKS